MPHRTTLVQGARLLLPGTLLSHHVGSMCALK